MNWKNIPALILGLSETGIAVAKSLNDFKVPVIGVDRQKEPAYYSKYFDQAYILPENSEEKMAAKLCHICLSFSESPIIFPTSDYYVNLVANFFEELELAARSPIILPEATNIILDKWHFYRFCITNDIPTPKTYLINSLADLKEAINRCGYPVIIKSRFPYAKRIPKIGKVKIVNSPSDLHSFAETDLGNGRFIVQEMIPGEDTNHFSFGSLIKKNGQLIGPLISQKIRQAPPNSGVGTLVRSVDNKVVSELGKRLIYSLDYHGVSEIELKKDDRDGKYKVIEMNARYWSQTALAIKCGLNFPVIHYCDLINTPLHIKTDVSIKTNVYWANLVDDFYGYFNRHNGYIYSPNSSFLKWIKILLKVRAFAFFSFRDPIPFFALIKKTFFKH